MIIQNASMLKGNKPHTKLLKIAGEKFPHKRVLVAQLLQGFPFGNPQFGILQRLKVEPRWLVGDIGSNIARNSLPSGESNLSVAF